MKKLIVGVGIFVIIVVTIVTVKCDDIIYWYNHYLHEDEYVSIVPNNYFVEDNFLYVNNYDKSEIFNKRQLIDFIYYFINSGAESIKGYCNKEYTECINDIELISSDQETLSILNNFVHPYNSFSEIEIKYNSKGDFTITLKKLYTSEQINAINKAVDDFIKNNITNDMSVREKLKEVHDYIIDTTDYDTYKTDNIKDDTYFSQNAYGVLVEHYGICSGYSDAMAIFLNKLGVINYKVSNKDHIWNLAFVDGKWLHIDLTWDDPVSERNVNRDNYFLITTKQLNALADDSHDFNKHIFQEA